MSRLEIFYDRRLICLLVELDLLLWVSLIDLNTDCLVAFGLVGVLTKLADVGLVPSDTSSYTYCETSTPGRTKSSNGVVN